MYNEQSTEISKEHSQNPYVGPTFVHIGCYGPLHCLCVCSSLLLFFRCIKNVKRFLSTSV